MIEFSVVDPRKCFQRKIQISNIREVIPAQMSSLCLLKPLFAHVLKRWKQFGNWKFKDMVTNMLMRMYVWDGYSNVWHVGDFDCVRGWSIRAFQVWASSILDLSKFWKMQVLVPNNMLSATHMDLGEKTPLQILHQLEVMHNCWLACKTWKIIVECGVQFSAARQIWLQDAPNNIRRRIMTQKYYTMAQL